MGQSPSAFKNWPDSDFMRRGAFLTTTDGEVILGKGGEITLSEKFLETETPVFYLKDFYSNKYLTYTPASILKISKADILASLKDHSEAHAPVSPVENDDELYQKDFQQLMSSFKKGLEKVVLISRETYEGFQQEKTIFHLLRRAFAIDAGWPYGLWNESYGVIGSTPELLYEVKNKTLSTFALAGTAREGEEEELLNSRKDRHEHELVVKDIKEKLSPFTSDLAVYETEILPFKNMVHLKTEVVARVKSEIDYTELTNSLSPTAALGGYPKEESLRFLQGTNYGQKYGHRYFGSCLGIMSPDDKEFVVSIRNVQWEEGHLFIESGGGIVPESNYQKELEEIHLKRNTIRNHYL